MKRPVIIMCLSLFLLQCKKANKNPCDVGGGVVLPFYRVFYLSNVGYGTVRVMVKNSDGTVITDGPIKDVYPYANCTSTQGVVIASLNVGENYTYHASSSTKVWDGNIATSCDQNSCETIELK